jgi:ketosteroid isomerase-like protein
VLNLLADDVDWAYLGPADIPFGGDYPGRDQVARFFAIVVENLEIQDFGVDQFIAQGDTVVVLGHERMRVRPTGRTYETD